VDREEFIEWMDEALVRCKKKSVVLHLKGIGGIGKSSLLNHWVNTHEKTIRLDCEQYSEFYPRLNMLAKGVVLQGVKLQRFDILWQIRQRFVEGVEPVREEGREWAKEVVMAIPFIGSLASIGSAISAVGSKVTPKLKGKYSTVGKWLQDTLGKNHIEQLLQILWKEPRRAEFLYLEAFLEDINNRIDSNVPLLFLLDHFEYVDNERAQWKYRGQKIDETQLWTLALSNLSNCVGVLASRRSAGKSKAIEIEETELTELDKDSCIEMLELQGVANERLQDRIVSVSGGNPFVIDVICDMFNTSDVSESDIENLRADTLSEVRLKVWRRLFREAEGLHNLINRAGILPYFDEKIMRIIAPELTPDSWDRLRRLSFVMMRTDGTFVMHDLAEDLVRAELRENLKSLALEVSSLLEKASEEQKDYQLLGLSFSVHFLADEIDTEIKIDKSINLLLFQNDSANAKLMLNAFITNSKLGSIIKDTWRAYVFLLIGSIPEAENSIERSLQIASDISEHSHPGTTRNLGRIYMVHARLLESTGRFHDAEKAYQKGIEILDELEPQDSREEMMKDDNYAGMYLYYGMLLSMLYRLRDAEKYIRKSMEIYEKRDWTPYYCPPELQTYEFFSQSALAMTLYFSGKIVEAESILRNIIESCDDKVNRGVALNRLQATLGFQHRHHDQLEVLNELLEKRKQLAQEDSDYENTVASTMSLLGRPLAQTGQFRKAEKIFTDSIQEFKRRAKDSGELSEDHIGALREYAVLLALSGRLKKAETTTIESVNMLRELVKASPERYMHRLAAAIGNLGIIYSRMGNNTKTQDSFLEAYSNAKEASLKHPEAVYIAERYCVVTNNFGVHYANIQQWKDAESYFDEAYKALSTYVDISPEMFHPYFALVVNNTGVLLSETDRIEEAESKFKEALEIRREYVARSENFFLPRVASVLNNLGIYYRRMGQPKESEKMYREALDIMNPLAEKEPRVHQSTYIKILSNSLILFSETKHSSAVEDTQAQLKKHGVKEVPADERWFVDMEYL